MTKLNPDAIALIEVTRQKWVKYKAAVDGAEAKIRARVKRETDTEVAGARLEVAESARLAMEAGSTKVRLREATSKNPGTLESLLALAEGALKPEVEAPTSDVGLQIEWAGHKVLRIQIDPQQIPTTYIERDVPELWAGFFEPFIRPSDGKVFIYPLISVPTLHGVKEWLNSNAANEQAVADWAATNPQ